MESLGRSVLHTLLNLTEDHYPRLLTDGRLQDGEWHTHAAWRRRRR